MNKELFSHLGNRVGIRLLLKQPCLFFKANYSKKGKTHYDALGVKPTATNREIKTAFYKLSLQYHPDKDDSEGAKERFQEISNAYEVLGNHDSRRQYDMRVRTMQGPSTVRRQPFTPTVNEVITPRDKIYDFDEWTRQHYQSAMGRVWTRKKRYDEYKEYIDEVRSIEASHKEGPAIVILIIFGIFVAYYYRHQNYDQPTRKTEAKSKDST